MAATIEALQRAIDGGTEAGALVAAIGAAERVAAAADDKPELTGCWLLLTHGWSVLVGKKMQLRRWRQSRQWKVSS
jgi:hypothetical protein